MNMHLKTVSLYAHELMSQNGGELVSWSLSVSAALCYSLPYIYGNWKKLLWCIYGKIKIPYMIYQYKRYLWKSQKVVFMMYYMKERGI